MIDGKDIKPAPYNPRDITKEELRGLRVSMKKFGDISGIVFNKKSGNLVGGHHRWEELEEEYGDLEVIHLKGEFHLISSKSKGFTGYMMRVVDWDTSTEKAANVTANSPTISGEFNTQLLTTVLDEIQLDLGEDFAALRLPELAFSISIGEEGEWEDEGESKTKPNLDGILSTIKVTCPQEKKEEVIGWLKKSFLDSNFEGVHIE